jgi:hypothetical protein
MHLDGDLVVVAVTVLSMLGVLTLGPIGRALAERLRGRAPAAPLADLEERLDEISGQVQALQRQLTETADRQDFTERLLARARERGQLEAPK